MADTQAKIAALTALAENYGASLSPALLKLWLHLLTPYTAEQVAAAVARVVTEYEYKTLPPFAVLRKALDVDAGNSQEAIEAQAAAEWTALIEAIAQRGSYGGPPPDMHPTTAYVLRSLGGWGAVCMWSKAWLDAKRRDFVDLWTQAHGRVEAMELGADAVKAALTAGAHGARGVERAGAVIGRLAIGPEARQ